MQDSKDVLNNLQKHAKDKNYIFKRLYRNFFNESFYYAVKDNIGSNQGNRTQTLRKRPKEITPERINTIINLLKDESYKPKSLKAGDRPSLNDLFIQEILRTLLETIYEPLFNENVYSFREGMNTQTALKAIKENYSDMTWFIMIDFNKSFIELDHKKLVEILRKRIKDERFLRLINKFLKKGYLEDWKYNLSFSKTPVGSILNPILSNIYFSELDSFILNILKKDFSLNKKAKLSINTEYLKKEKALIENSEILTNIKKKKLILKELKNENYFIKESSYKASRYLRYAGSVLIGLNTSKKEVEELIKEISFFLKEDLKINEFEIKLFHHSDTIRFLETNIKAKNFNSRKGIEKTQSDYKGARYIDLLIPKDVIERFILDRRIIRDINKKPWKVLHRPGISNYEDKKIIEIFNSDLKGIYMYYSLCSNVSQKMGQLKHVLELSCLKTFGNKYKTHVSKLVKRFDNNGEWGIWDKDRFIPFFKGFKKRDNYNPTIDLKHLKRK